MSTPTHTAEAAAVRATELLTLLSEVCPEAAWIGGHLVRVLANVEAISDFTDFDIAVPRSKLAAIEAHVAQLGWEPTQPANDLDTGDCTPLPHHQWRTATRERFGRDEIVWPSRISVDLVIYDDTAGETLVGLVERFDLNVLRLWATLAGGVPRHPAPVGWARMPITEDLYVCVETTVPNAYDAIATGDVQIVPGAWTRPWRLGKYRLALGLGPLSGEYLPIIRMPDVKRDDLPPAGFQWIHWRDMQSWRNSGAYRAPWVLGDLSAYTDAQVLHDRAVAQGVAREDAWDLVPSAEAPLHTGDPYDASIRNAYIVWIQPGNPEAPSIGAYVREWHGTVTFTDVTNPSLFKAWRFPEDVFERIMALRGGA